MDGLAFNTDKQFLAAPMKYAADKFQLIPEFVKVRGLVNQHLDSFNYFLWTQIRKIVGANDLITSNVEPTVYLRYKSVWIGKPDRYTDVTGRYWKPQECRLADRTYATPIHANVEYCNGPRDPPVEKDIIIGQLPIMLRSCCCVLHGITEDELSRLGECPLDPGGYFIIKGTEKVILIQEQLSKNRIIIDTDKKGCVQASVMTITEAAKGKAVIKMDKEKIYLYLNQFASKVPIMAVMKAMGMESDQEVVQMMGRDPRYSALLLPSIEDCAQNGVYTRQEALEFLDKKVKDQQYCSASFEKEGKALGILRDVFVAHVPVRENNFRPKCIYIAVMLRRMMEAILNKDAMDDKDYMGNKRLVLPGQLLALLFEGLFRTMNEELKKIVDLILRKDRTREFDLLEHVNGNIITQGFERMLSTGNLDIKRFKINAKGLTQVVSRLSFIATLGHMTRISQQVGVSRKVSGPRALHPSQWGMLCPCDTPEGESCGLVKNLALMTHVTTDEEEGPIASLCSSLGVEDLALFSGEELHTQDSYLILLNGIILGKHRQPQLFANTMRKLRRAGEIGEFVSVFVNEKQRCVYIASDGGRVCRPLVIVEKGVSRIKESHLKQLLDGRCNFHDFVRKGLIEYLDVNEENNALVALYEGEATSETTHVEIEPFTILGVCAGLIPFPHHNQSTRNTYQCAMGKQAMGNIAYNQLRRMDKVMFLLVYPQRPLLTTRTIELVGYDRLGAGQNATVAVMSFSGYDMMDAIVMNKSSLDNGFGRCVVMKRISAILEKYKDTDILAAKLYNSKKLEINKEQLRILDADGLAIPGEIIRSNDVLIKGRRLLHPGNVNLKPEFVEGVRFYQFPDGETAVVDRVALFSDESGNSNFKFIIRHTRRPEDGDKFSSRHGVKGVCGTIIRHEDFPFSECGICPDLIMNLHAFPSGMTVGQMMELLGSKAGVLSGKFHYGSAFGEPSGHADRVETMSETLLKHGFSYSGKDFLYSGITGSPLQAYIFMGPIYYQKLKHMVVDKSRACRRKTVDYITRQVTEGVRVGERERDCLIAYGASMLIYERLMISGDSSEVQVCQKCGLLGYYHHKLQTSVCSTCKNGDNMSTLKLPYACKLLFQELQSMNIVPRLKLTEA